MMPNAAQSPLNFGWNFDNSYIRLPKVFYDGLNPVPVRIPKLVAFNRSLSLTLGLNNRALDSAEGTAVFAGNSIPEGAEPLAQAYAGHQFGYFTMLGDGRAILLGEHLTPEGERFDIQLKGSGRTPFSRQGDGRAALGPMLREYIISEAMHALGIPTTRSLAVVTTGEPVYRETPLQGAILTRVAASHLRVGTFAYVAALRDTESLRAIADYSIHRHYRELAGDANPYLSLLYAVTKRQAKLVSQWMQVGFIHGVMNTDNMSLCGETIDYGPCAFMDSYDPATVFSSIDQHGRYAYGNQPSIAHWNIARFAETLVPLLDDTPQRAVSLANEAISSFPDTYRLHWISGMRAKLGLFNEEPGDEELAEALLTCMKRNGTDTTNTFRDLASQTLPDTPVFRGPGFSQWYEMWKARLKRQAQSWEESRNRMRAHSPAVIPRNHRVEAALEAAVERDDFRVMERLLDVLSHPYEDRPETAEYRQLPPSSNKSYQTFCGT